MPITIPAFNQYQAPIVPLRGLWNNPPVEGDKFVTAEIDWLVTTTQQAVQFSISANSPVAFSQIVALAVDNSRSGADITFVFSDSGFELVVPAHEQVIAPVFTNALMFYVIASAAIAGDITAFQVLNSMPPPVALAPASTQNHANIGAVNLVNGTTPVVAAGINGTLNTISITAAITEGASAGNAIVQLFDGLGRELWLGLINAPANGVVDPTFPLTGLNIRFVNGVNLVVSSSTLTGTLVANLYYSQP